MKLRILQVGEEGAAGTSYHIQRKVIFFWVTLETMYSRFAASTAMRKWIDNLKLSKEISKNRKKEEVLLEVDV
jgi:hypothetical protein